METASLRRNIDIHKKNIKELATVLRIFVAHLLLVQVNFILKKT